MKVVVILPTFNERENIATLLDQLRQAVSGIRNHTFRYLVVDDTSPDGTADEVRKYAAKHKSVSLITGKKEGLGKALLRGMAYAAEKMGADIIVQMDADLSHDPTVVPELIRAIDNGADFAVGSRYIPGGSIPEDWGLHRKIYSVVGNAIVRYGLGHLSVHDWTGGFRAYKSGWYERNRHGMDRYSGYVFQIAFLDKALSAGARITEVPIHFADRKYGHSKIAPSEYIRTIFEYIIRARYRSVRHGTFGKFLVVGSFGFFINTIVLEVMVRLGYNPALGSAVGAECAIISNFILNNAWTFSHNRIRGKRMIVKFFHFNGTSLGALIIQSGTVWAGTVSFGDSLYRIYYILGVGLGLIWNYYMYSRVIWKKQPA